MRDAGVVAKLRANTDPAKLYAILTESRATQAA
jgi:PTS system nitrogen regulatory IIA component